MLWSTSTYTRAFIKWNSWLLEMKTEENYVDTFSFSINMANFEAFCRNKKLTSNLCFLKCVWEVFSYYIISILTCYDCYMGPRITIFFLFERILLHYFLEYFWSNQNFLVVFCPRVFLIQLSCKCLCRDIMMLNWLKFVKTIWFLDEKFILYVTSI